MQTKTFDSVFRSLSPAVTNTLTNATSAALLGLGLSRRRSAAANPIAWLAAGLAIGGTAALFLAPEGTRDRLTRLFQRTGGGVGKRVGQLIGQEAGAHPVATAKFVEQTRDLLSSRRS
jgi:hypothetical protein